jgi:AcrR family transcriptional regulator
MNKRRDVKREYRSERRQAGAASTRLSIISAATSLFVELGYGPVSIDAIADEASVSRATVFNAVGGKASLLRAAYDVAIVGDDEPVPLPERPWARPVREAPDAYTMLTRYAHMITVVDDRVCDIYEVMRGAAGAHADVREHWDQIQEERRGGAANVVRMLQARGTLRAGLTRRSAADIVFVLIDPGLFHQLVRTRQWKTAAFESWLAETFHMQLLESGGSSTTR